MKKIFTVFLTGVLTMGLLAGCGSSAGSNNSSTSQNTTEAASESTESSETAGAESETAADTEASEAAAGETTADEGKTLVVYYSATGSTQAVAEYIAQSTGGDLFEIQPTEPYTSDDLNWSNSDSRVSREHDNEDERDVELVSTTVDNWDEYDTVFIGYPIWWGIAAWPVDNFIKANDFTGKTVIPFCTSASSGIGDSGNLLAAMAGTGDWQDGERFRSSASESDVTEWVDSLNLK